MKQDENDMLMLLLGHKTPRVAEMERDGAVPSFLAWKYAREAAAREAATIPEPSSVLLAALLRAAFLDEEEDVRAAARHTLILRDERIGDVIHLALTMDTDPGVRESALDEALEVADESRRARLVQQAVEALRHDECEVVRARALEFVDFNPSGPPPESQL